MGKGFVYINRLYGYAGLILFLTLPGYASQESGCEQAFVDEPVLTEEIPVEGRSRAEEMASESADLSEFLHTGWPELLRIAAEAGKAPEELIQEAYDLILLSYEGLGQPIEMIQASRRVIDSVVTTAEWLHEQPGPLDLRKLRRRELEAIRTVHVALRGIALFARTAEMELHQASRINPGLPLDGPQIDLIFKTLAKAGEEATLAFISKGPGGETDETQAGDLAAVPKKSARAKPEPTEEPLALKDFLTPDAKLVANQVYAFTNAHQGDFLIEFEREVVKEAAKGHDPSIKRLLHSLFTGDGVVSGLKRLPNSGKEVVEIKAIMRGHKRLIGCLKGRHVVIKKFLDLPESPNSYRKLIPANICAG